jgi:hypothetical protein
MTEEQFSASLRPFCRRRPFRPFFIEFTNGTTLRITHPEGVAPFSEVWFYRSPSGSPIVFASSSVCRLLEALAEAEA